MESNDRNDRLIHDNVERFAAALQAGRAKVGDPMWPQVWVAVLDGSNQDATTCAILTRLAEAHRARVFVTAGVLAEDANRREDIAIDAALLVLSKSGIRAEGVMSQRAESHERILQVLEDRKADLCLLPCPFAHDLGDLGESTLGTVVEVCLARSRTPVLIVRGPLSEDVNALDRPHLILERPDRAATHAIRLALGRLQASTASEPAKADRTEPLVLAGTLGITFIYHGAEDSDVDDAMALGYRVAPADLIPLLSKGLSGYLHHLLGLREQHPGLSLEARLVHPDGELVDEAEERNRLHIVPMEPVERGVPELVQRFVLSTLDPVLVVSAP